MCQSQLTCDKVDMIKNEFAASGGLCARRNELSAECRKTIRMNRFVVKSIFIRMTLLDKFYK